MASIKNDTIGFFLLSLSKMIFTYVGEIKIDMKLLKLCKYLKI